MLLFLAAVTFFLRAYRVSSLPLWLDEIYGYQLGVKGLGAILRNSLTDPHPPVWYFIQWASTGFGLLHSEWGMRWLSVASGSLTILLTYRMALKHVGSSSAFLGSLLFAISPFHIFFSQESRSPAWVALLAIVTMFLMEQVTASPEKRSVWIRYGLLSLLGLYSSYSFALVVATQIVFLFIFAKAWRATLMYTAALAVLCLPLAYLFFQSIPAVSNIHSGVESDPVTVLQVLAAGTPVGFVFFSGQMIVTAGLALTVLSAISRIKNCSPTFVHCLLQVGTPFFVFWGVLAPFFDIRLPVSESRQFIIVLPAFYILVCFGFRTWSRISDPVLAKAFVVSLYCLVGASTLVSLTHYWRSGKSSEGERARQFWLFANRSNRVMQL